MTALQIAIHLYWGFACGDSVPGEWCSGAAPVVSAVVDADQEYSLDGCVGLAWAIDDIDGVSAWCGNGLMVNVATDLPMMYVYVAGSSAAIDLPIVHGVP